MQEQNNQDDIKVIDNLTIKESSIVGDQFVTVCDECVVTVPLAFIGKENRNKTTLSQHLAQQLSKKDVKELSKMEDRIKIKEKYEYLAKRSKYKED